MMSAVLIGSRSTHLLVTLEERPNSAERDLVAELRGRGLSTHVRVEWANDEIFRLSSLFDDLARDWAGWDGDRSWESLEGEMIISARHHQNHVTLQVTLHQMGLGYNGGEWRVEGIVSVDPGEELSRIAADLRALLA